MKCIRYLSVFFLLFLLHISSVLAAGTMEDLRVNFVKAVSDKSLCKSMITELSKEKINPVQEAYLGALETIWAKYTFNPYSKLKTFNKGKREINEAVNLDPDNVEIRFVRLSIQLNSPPFLGYRDNIDEDKAFIKKNLDTITSPTLKQMINNLLEADDK